MRYFHIFHTMLIILLLFCCTPSSPGKERSTNRCPEVEKLEEEIKRMASNVEGMPKYIELTYDSVFMELYYNPDECYDSILVFISKQPSLTEKQVAILAMTLLPDVKDYIALVNISLKQYAENEDYNNFILYCISNEFGSPLENYRNKDVAKFLTKMDSLTSSSNYYNEIIKEIKNGG